jgi:hypothetical protein
MDSGQRIVEHDTSPDFPDYLKALVRDIMRRIDLVWWNNNQYTFEWSHGGVEWITPQFQIRTYYWGDDEEVAALPNMYFEGVAISWYKYPLRGAEVNCTKSVEEWISWYQKFMTAVTELEND